MPQRTSRRKPAVRGEWQARQRDQSGPDHAFRGDQPLAAGAQDGRPARRSAASAIAGAAAVAATSMPTNPPPITTMPVSCRADPRQLTERRAAGAVS
ncbi:hypothetical protein [Amycolatopsis sp. NPDC003861]